MPLPPWRPVIDGELRAAALGTVREISSALADPDHAAMPSLSAGAAGIALMFGYLAQAHDEAGVPEAGDLAWKYLDAARRHIAESTLSATLYGGFVGIGWLLEHVERHLVEAPEDGPDALGALDAALLKMTGAPPWSTPYDLVSGLVGVGVFALERVRSPSRAALLAMVAQRLAAIAVPDGAGLTWRTPAKFLDGEHAQLPDVVDLGVAHGVAGAVALLGELVARGVPAAEPCYRGAVAWLLSQRQEPPAVSSFGLYVIPGRPPGRSRLAWCYGDPGAAAALCVAAVATGDQSLLDHARQIAVRAARRDPGTSSIGEPGLCHGSIGLALCFQLVWVATADEDCAEAARFWVRDALSRRIPEGCAGFFRTRRTKDGGEVREPSAGFLNGAAGVALGLLAASTAHAPVWARVLLAYPAAG